MTIDITKVYTTKEGLEVVSLFHYPDNPPHAKIIAHFRCTDGEVFSRNLSEEGRSFTNATMYDLVLAPVEITLWFNVYQRSNGDFFSSVSHRTEALANAGASNGRTTCIKSTFTVPQVQL